MDTGRILLTAGFWLVFPFAFDAAAGALFPDLSQEGWILLWFTGLCAGTFIVNFAWYWFRLRR